MIPGHVTWGLDIRWHAVSPRKPKLAARWHKFVVYRAISGAISFDQLVSA
jgi:hypothetical protein